MIEFFAKKLFKDTCEQMKVFNIVHSICVVSMFLVCIIIDFFTNDMRMVYLSIGICVLFIFTMIEANRTGRYKKCLVFMSVVFNFVYMPIMFFLFNRFICTVPIYFLFGMLYSVLLVDKKTGIILSISEGLVYFVLIVYGSRNMLFSAEGISQRELFIRYTGTMIGVLVSGVCVGTAVRFRYLYYQKEFRKAEEQKKEAEAAYIARDMFLINMSHQIRTPMNAIVGTVDLLLQQNISDHVSDGVYNILNSCNALLSITDEIMDLSKSERGEIEVYETAYDLDELLMEVVNMMAIRLNETNLSFHADFNKDIPRHLYGDASKIRQIFVNLLNNAAKYTESGKIVLRVDYGFIAEDQIELIVDIEDTGVGINENIIKDIFKRDNVKNDNSGDNESGTGIGLAICSELLEKMHGEISVNSKVNVGSLFTFKLPQKVTADDKIAYVAKSSDIYCLIFEKDSGYNEIVRRMLNSLNIKCDTVNFKQDFERLMSVNSYTHILVDNGRFSEINNFLENNLITANIISIMNIDDSVSSARIKTVINRPLNIINLAALLKNETNTYVREVSKRGRFNCPNATILVVDDNYTNLSVASAILGKYGARVLNANSGKECLRMLQENNIDIVFLDYMMPEMNGIDTLEAIRQIPGSRYASLPVIALTANVISGAREMFLEAGFDDFMSKPISIEKIEKIILKYLPKDFIVYGD